MHDPPPKRTDADLLETLRKDTHYLYGIEQNLNFIRREMERLAGMVFEMLEYLDV